MSEQERMPFVPEEWTTNDTAEYLRLNPLPAEFTWAHRDGGEAAVHPTYRTHGGYGKWLRETPYFPGLFELIHEFLFHAPGVPPIEGVVAEMERIKRERAAQGTLF